MIRMHLDDIRDCMPPEQFAYLRRWLDQHGAIIVQCDDIPVAPTASGAHWGSQRGRWGVDEPYPPYGGYRKLFEDARRQVPGNSQPVGDITPPTP